MATIYEILSTEQSLINGPKIDGHFKRANLESLTMTLSQLFQMQFLLLVPTQDKIQQIDSIQFSEDNLESAVSKLLNHFPHLMHKVCGNCLYIYHPRFISLNHFHHSLEMEFCYRSHYQCEPISTNLLSLFMFFSKVFKRNIICPVELLAPALPITIKLEPLEKIGSLMAKIKTEIPLLEFRCFDETLILYKSGRSKNLIH
jgi:hypothetical protein